MEFEWNEAKNQTTLLKHKVDFSIVHEFDWDRSSLRQDTRRDYGEDRLVAYGPAKDGQLYVIVFTPRDDRYRIITVRHFGRKDHLHYEPPHS